jgi:hypothetical protein
MVCGVEIKKMPVGKYLDAMERIGGILMDLIEDAFPGMKPGDILAQLTVLTSEDFRALAVRLLSVVPGKAIEIMATIMDVDIAVIRDRLSPAELMQVWTAFWKLNDLTDFFMNVRSAVLPMLRTTTKKASIGSSGSQPPVSQSESASRK